MGNRMHTCERTCVHCAAHCAKATGGGGSGVDDFVEEQLTCDPAGAIFEETLEELNDIDRQLLLFSAGTNLAAVRWLFVLGADKLAVDSNRTSALHTACRTGTLPIVKELIKQGISLEVTDSSGWTPLHIAIFMGRRDAVLALLRASAQLSIRNSKGQAPLEMCTDSWTREAIEAFRMHARQFPGRPFVYDREHEARQDTMLSSRLQYEPFFVPRSPVISDVAHKQDFHSLGATLFNKRPGQGLAFLVASGATHDYPVDLSAFLRRGKLDLSQIGNFLGESFSLSQTLRLEFINSVKFHGTSIVSSLAKVFTLLQIPPDLQKIDRLVHGVARIWWRQHDKISEEHDQDGMPGEGDDMMAAGHWLGSGGGSGPGTSGDAELESFELKQYLTSPETLYQMMFSVVMLHWNLYAPSLDDGEDGRINMSKWLEINKGLESDGSDVPAHILQRTYRTVRGGFIPQLAIRRPARANGGNSWDADRGSLVHAVSSIEGWAWIVGHSFVNSVVIGRTRGAQISSIFSENVTNVTRGDTPARTPTAMRVTSEGSALAVPTSWDSKSDEDRVWLSLAHSLLFFSVSPSPDEAPYAFVHLRQVLVERTEPELSTLALVANPEGGGSALEGCDVAGDGLEGAAGRSGGRRAEPMRHVIVIFLLPDGRWQEFELPRLEIQVADEQQMEKWVAQLRAVCGEVFVPPRSDGPGPPDPVSGLYAKSAQGKVVWS